MSYSRMASGLLHARRGPGFVLAALSLGALLALGSCALPEIAGSRDTAKALNGSTDVAPTPIYMGEQNVLTLVDGNNANLLCAQQTTLAQSATLQTLSFYVTTAAGSLRLGVFDASGPSGRPGVKVAETNEITPVVGWNTASVVTPTLLAAGTYWLTYLPSSNALHFRRAGSGSVAYYSYTYRPMPQTFSTSPQTVADHWSFYATLLPVSAANAPSVATAAAVNPNPVNTTTATVSVLGADSAGEATLSYTWSATGPAPVSFSPNASNAAKTSVATFTASGNYVLQATITDPQGLTVASTVAVTVNPVRSSISVSPATAAVSASGTQQFAVAAAD
ncbi:MAG TPA: hypothetical protein VFI08_11845, partial [Spirochaetia bacterium]|nr:hypothetical protein [Spirochaetia bacterium]